MLRILIALLGGLTLAESQTVEVTVTGVLEVTVKLSNFASYVNKQVQVKQSLGPGSPVDTYIGTINGTNVTINEDTFGDFLVDGTGSPFEGFEKSELFLFTVDGIIVGPRTIIGRSDPPTDFTVCSTSTPQAACNDVLQEVNALRASWTEPTDTGAGGTLEDPGVASYTLEASLNNSFDVIASATSLDNSAAEGSVSGLLSGFYYYLRVRVVTNLGEGKNTDPSSATLAIGAPLAPNLTAVDSGSEGGNYLRITWSPPSDYGDLGKGGVVANETWIEVSTSSGFGTLVDSTAMLVAETGVANQTTIVRLAGFVRGTQYFVRLRDAHYAFGFRVLGDYSNIVSEVLVGVPGVPEANLMISAPLEMNLSWSPPLDLGGGDGVAYPLLAYEYSVYSNANQHPSTGSVTAVNASVTSIVLTGLTKGVEYFASVRAQNDAVDNGGWSEWYNETSCDGTILHDRFSTCGVIASDVPGPPQNLSIVSLPGAPSASQNAVFQATWRTPLDTGSGDGHFVILQFDVLWYQPDGQFEAFVVSGDSLSHEVELPITGQDYTVVVRAVNQAGAGALVNTSRPGLLLPSAPRNLSATYVSEIGSDIIATDLAFAVPNYTGFRNTTWSVVYEVDVASLNATNPSAAVCVSDFTLQVMDNLYSTVVNLTRGCTYRYRVRAINAAGNGAWSNFLSFVPIGLPSTPDSFAVLNNLNEQITLVWATSLDAGDAAANAQLLSGYWVDWSYFQDFSEIQESRQLNSSVNAFTFKSLIACLPHYFRIRTENSIGPSEYSTLTAQPNNCTLIIDVFCPAGEWLRVRSALDSRCQPCPVGSSSLAGSENVTNCTCRVGYTGADGTNCSQCQPGTYKNLNGSSPCLDCAAGSYLNETGASVCVGCPSNTDSAPGAAVIEQCICVIGFEGRDGAACSPCALGTFKPVNGSTPCLSCAAGTYLNSTGGSVCLDCPLFTWSVNRSSTFQNCTCNAGYTGPPDACAPCLSGTYKVQIGSALCTDCPLHTDSPPASFSLQHCTCNQGFAGPDGSQCTPCQAATYKNFTGSGACADCPSNMVSPNASVVITNCTCNMGYSGSDGGPCSGCAPGSYKDVLGTSGCEPCAAGTAAPFPGTPVCGNCTPGTYQNETAQTRCIDCAFQTYTEEVASLGCLPCNVSLCAVGEYRLECYKWRYGRCTACDKKPAETFYTHAGDPYYENNCRFRCITGELYHTDDDTCTVSCR